MNRNFITPADAPLRYYGCSDMLGQIALELSNNPDSCLSQNVLAWYNSLYSELSDFDDCRYQVLINEDLCPDSNVDSPEEVFDILVNFELVDLQSFLVAYVVNKALEFGTEQGRRLVRDVRRQLTREFNQAARR